MSKEKIMQISIFVAGDDSVSSEMECHPVFRDQMIQKPLKFDEFLEELVEVLKKNIIGTNNGETK